MCILGLHNYEIIKEEDLVMFDKVVGKIIISRCANCGKIKEYRYHTVKY